MGIQQNILRAHGGEPAKLFHHAHRFTPNNVGHSAQQACLAQHKMRRGQEPWWLLAIIILLLLSALCSAQNDTANKTTPPYTLGAGDKILIKVFGELDLTISVILTGSGSFSYPFLGEIKALGLTVAELEQLITKGLKGQYLLNPAVTVLIEEYRPFYLNGEVKQPGGYPYRPSLTLEKALTLAGGFTERASRKKIIVLRAGANGKEKQSIGLNDPVYPGDVITVHRSFF
ncbi:MAG: polysaccharide biosynthesis/export family protein [Pseudomonadales bacterium]